MTRAPVHALVAPDAAAPHWPLAATSGDCFTRPGTTIVPIVVLAQVFGEVVVVEDL